MTTVTYIIPGGTTVNTAEEFAKNIIARAMVDTYFKPIPKGNRFGIITHVYLMDEVPNNLYLQKETELDFWNEISGFFHANEDRGICDARTLDWEIPEDVKLIKEFSHNSDANPLWVVGDRIVDKDYNVYKVVGFISNSSRSSYYYDIK